MADKLLLSVKVATGAKKEVVREETKGRLFISVREKAERGEANRRIREVLAERFRVPLKAVHITAGHHKGAKRIEMYVDKKV